MKVNITKPAKGLAQKLARKVSRVMKGKKVASLTPTAISPTEGVGENSDINSTTPIPSISPASLNLPMITEAPSRVFLTPNLRDPSDGTMAPDMLISNSGVVSVSLVSPYSQANYMVQLPLLHKFDAKSIAFKAYEVLEHILRYTAPQELHTLRGVTTAFHDVIKSSVTIKYITFRQEGIPRSLQAEPGFLKHHIGPKDSEVQLHPFVDRLVRKLWDFAMNSDPDETFSAVDPLAEWYLKIPNDVYVTRPPVKVMSLMFNDPNNIRHIIITSPTAGVTLRQFIQTLARPLIRRCGELLASNRRDRFPLPDICVSVRFKYPVYGVRNINNQQDDDNIDLAQYQQDYGAHFITRNRKTYWFWSADDGAAVPALGEVRKTVWNMPIHERCREDMTVLWKPVLKLSFWRRDPTNKGSMISVERRGAVHLTGGWGVRWGR
ncbi:hypothetical protein TWF506_004684 [Arthrobotrys conoides]|uniref:F-box domain-containing protein n=1 Tax=Arthrobotrys conoides TaxID=74498 RepID=A0AAN8RP14_9PEZI